MTDTFRIGLAQLNPVMGDIADNIAKARATRGSRTCVFDGPRVGFAALR